MNTFLFHNCKKRYIKYTKDLFNDVLRYSPKDRLFIKRIEKRHPSIPYEACDLIAKLRCKEMESLGYRKEQVDEE